MWRPYLQLIAKHCTQALNILDRFHVVATLNLALDDVRASEARRMVREGYEPVLKKKRWCLLKRPANLTDNQRMSLRELLGYNLKSVRAYLLKEEFQLFWEYDSPAWAAKFLDAWCTRAMRSRIEPVKKFARTVRAHRELLLNYFRAKKQFSSGIIEGLNNKAKVTMRKTGLDIRTPPEGKERCAREAIGGAEPALRTRLPWVPFARAHDLCRPGVLAAFRMDYVLAGGGAGT
jgi:transposase